MFAGESSDTKSSVFVGKPTDEKRSDDEYHPKEGGKRPATFMQHSRNRATFKKVKAADTVGRGKETAQAKQAKPVSRRRFHVDVLSCATCITILTADTAEFDLEKFGDSATRPTSSGNIEDELEDDYGSAEVSESLHHFDSNSVLINSFSRNIRRAALSGTGITEKRKSERKNRRKRHANDLHNASGDHMVTSIETLYW